MRVCVLCTLCVSVTGNFIRRSFYNADGDLLIVAQEGRLRVLTEMGILHVSPGEIVVVPRGIVEIFKGHFMLPELGPIGANGLANPRDFKYPVAHFDDFGGLVAGYQHVVLCKMGGSLFSRIINRSPYDVVAWHGNYAPYKYNLANFCTINRLRLLLVIDSLINITRAITQLNVI